MMTMLLRSHAFYGPHEAAALRKHGSPSYRYAELTPTCLQSPASL
jgi:hypothetical protein